MYLTLSPRLRRIAAYVRPGEKVIDVGTDHAYIPIWLLQNGLCDRAVATDIKSGPLQRAAADARKYDVSERLTLLLCDGLAACTAEMADTIILAGMGGETIWGILEAAPWALKKRLILQPQTKQPELRAWLSAHGLAIGDASLVYDTGRIYQVWLVETGEMAAYAAVEPALLEKQDPLLRPFLEERIKRLRKQLNGMESAKTPDTAALDALRRELNDILRIHEEVLTWQA